MTKNDDEWCKLVSICFESTKLFSLHISRLSCILNMATAGSENENDVLDWEWVGMRMGMSLWEWQGMWTIMVVRAYVYTHWSRDTTHRTFKDCVEVDAPVHDNIRSKGQRSKVKVTKSRNLLLVRDDHIDIRLGKNVLRRQYSKLTNTISR